ncbi:type 1 glutamine amidotransferase [Natronosalvus rutilus]|uniref:Type 1 glutamine amidotransferase n=1 Tax=Natronosalvus rutilus TaxID=2953753 RepID=A0A9E7N9K9_9EURY|nr:type 1 glutamine amidotransferase [Natronosalvus rutilus]UTF53970.1 type 1 glutamine amidotransferase [Natronosalvus rutilus]
MTQVRLALLNAAYEGESTRRNFRRELDASLAEFDITDGELPETYDYDGVVVTGSRASVYWDEDWIEPAKTWVAEAIDRDVPFLGICWGHQLLADVLGGSVDDMGEYEVGYSHIEHTGDSPLFDGIDREFVGYTSHSDAVLELPPNAEPLAENEYSNHGYRLGNVFGVQFHPEFDQPTMRKLLENKDLESETRERLLAEVTDENHARTRPASLVFENFVDFVREVRERAAADDGARDVSA